MSETLDELEDKTMDIHEAANLFPMAEKSLEDLVVDIAYNGLRVPIELCEGKIIDGRRRWIACEKAGVPVKTVEVNPADPVAYVLSLNLHRRHLTPSQRAMVAARARSIYDRQARERQATSTGGAGPQLVANLPEAGARSRDAAGKVVGVGGKSVDHATKVLTRGVPELVAAVDEGRMAVSTAAVLAHEPEETQREQATKATRIYKTGVGGGTERESKRHVVVNGMLYTGLRFADMAIEQLKRIQDEDPTREEALSRVEKWIQRNRNVATQRSMP